MKKLTSRIGRAVIAAAIVLALAPLAHAQAQNINIPVKGVTFAIEVPGTFVGRQAGPNYIAYRELIGAIFPCSEYLTLPLAGCAPGENTTGFYAFSLAPDQGLMTIQESAQRIANGGFYNANAKQQIVGGQIWINGVPTYVDCNLNLTVIASGQLLPGLPIDQATASNISGTWVITSGTCAGGISVTGHGTLAVDSFGTSGGGLANVPVYEGTISIHTPQ